MNGLIPRDDTVLVVVDIQEKLFPAIADKEAILANSLKVIEFANRLEIPILVTEQYPSGLGATLPEVQKALGQAYAPIAKTAFSCFGEPTFVDALKELDRGWIVLIGIETHVCVAQTALAGMNFFIDDSDDYDFSVSVLADCVSARTKQFHDVGIERMRDEGVAVSTSDAFFYEMLVEAKTDDHKKVFDLLK
jgi:nicotinamidase-related amidase